MTMMISFGGFADDPLYLITNIVAVACIGVMIWFGMRALKKGGDKDGGIKLKVSKL